MREFGIDISRWQGNFDMAKAKSEGVKFVIIKGGGGDNSLYIDQKFEVNYNNAKSLHLPTGCYWFSKALTIAAAKKEAEYFYTNCIKGKKFELPIYIDVENKEQLAVGKRLLTDIIKAWCDYLESKNCYVGIYSSLSMYSTYMYDDELQKYAHWVAQWSTSCTYKKDYGMWQFGGETNKIRTNKIAGIVCDQDYMLVDYPSIIKNAGKNGYSKGTSNAGGGNSMIDNNLKGAARLIAVAEEEIGYLEKATNNQLDDKTANAGYNNYTKYARDLDNIANFYNGKKNGYAWCDVFVDWCFVKAFGVDNAKKLLNQPARSLGAGVNYSRNYFQSIGRLYPTPQPGDQVFFGTSHTGIVKSVSGNIFTTIEGNTSSAAGVVSNGGGVFEKSYNVNSNYKFGRPDWTIVDDTTSTTTTTSKITTTKYNISPTTLKKGMKSKQVKALQILLNGYGFNCGSVDSDFGTKTENAVKNYQRANGLFVDGIVGKNTFSSLLGI